MIQLFVSLEAVFFLSAVHTEREGHLLKRSTSSADLKQVWKVFSETCQTCLARGDSRTKENVLEPGNESLSLISQKLLLLRLVLKPLGM